MAIVVANNLSGVEPDGKDTIAVWRGTALGSPYKPGDHCIYLKRIVDKDGLAEAYKAWFDYMVNLPSPHMVDVLDHIAQRHVEGHTVTLVQAVTDNHGHVIRDFIINRLKELGYE